MLVNTINGAIIIISSFIVLESAIEYSKIMKEFKLFEYDKNRFIKLAPVVIFIMMWIFFFSYIGIGIVVGLDFAINKLGLVSAVFLLGGVFTYFVIRIQKKMLEYLESSNIESISALVNAIEARDEYTKGHSEHVANLVELYYNELPEKEKRGLAVKKLKVAGLLHDIGKIGVREVILNKPGKLDELEYAAISRHPEIGNNILSSVTHLRDIAKWIYYHHERVDGKGYYGKTLSEIPVEARIIAVADTYSALVTDRIYRPGLNHQESLEILRTLRGTQLDATILDRFINIPADKMEKCKGEAFNIEKGIEDKNLHMG